MGDSQEDDNLGPLPQADRTDELEQLGIEALKAALPKGAFLFRDERVDDKGVDGSLEVKLHNRYTNLRSQVQLKSTDADAQNQDGTVSWLVETSNLNYLLNGPSPLYVLYIAPRDELRFAWARDELRRLDVENPDWRNQQKVTLRFAEVISEEAAAAIHSRIQREAQCNRTIHEILGRSSIAEDVAIAINAASFKVTDPHDLYRFLSTAGMTAVCSGYAAQVLEKTRLLNHDARNDPRIKLVCAYAEHSLGKFFAALGHLAEVFASREQLADYDRYFFDLLHNASQLQVGAISQKEFDQREAALLREAPEVLRLQRELSDLKNQILRGKGDGNRRQLLGDLQRIETSIEARSDVNAAFKLHARIELLWAQGKMLVDDFSSAASVKGLRGDLGMAYDTPQSISRARDILERKRQWVEMGNKIIEAAATLEHPILFGNALLASSSTIITLLGQRRILAGSADVPPSMLGRLVEHVEKAIEMFEHTGAVDRELRARLLRADLHEFIGESDEARRLADEVLPRAQGMGYEQIAADAQRHLDGESSWKEAETHLADLLGQDPNPAIAQQSDGQIREFARFLHKALEVPMDRLPIVERYCECMREGARQRLSWCRDLVIAGDDDSFSVEPSRFCICQKHNYRTQFPHPDWNTVIQGFKQTYCDGCPDRAPASDP